MSSVHTHTEGWTICKLSQSVDFGVSFNISVCEDGFHLGECVFRQNNFFFISVSNLASGVIVKLKYLKVSHCFILSPLQRILHT